MLKLGSENREQHSSASNSILQKKMWGLFINTIHDIIIICLDCLTFILTITSFQHLKAIRWTQKKKKGHWLSMF